MTDSSYTEAKFQEDLAELTKLINNYGTDEPVSKKKTAVKKGGDDMEGGKRRKRSRKSKKSSKRRSRKHSRKHRGGDDMEGGKRRKHSRKSKKSSKKSSKRRSRKHRGGDDMEGGKRKHHSPKHGGVKRVHKIDSEGHLIRSFRVIEINGRDVSKETHWVQRFYHGKAKKNTPLQGAKNAFRWMCKHIKQGRDKCHASFKLIETTKGGADYGKVFGPYSAKTVKLAKPIIFKRKDKRTGKMKEIKSHYTYEIKLGKSHK